MITVHVDKDIEDLIPGFMANRRRDAERIDAALQTGDFDAIRMLGHSMKGSGGGYGFDAITEIGARIESAAIENNADNVAALNRELRDYLQNVNVEFR
jgi:HPt (histidine-containing phosphotransfer) domain-containing protein